MGNMIIIGHRGAAGYAPENTLASFKKALDLNVDMIEFDIHKCLSGELVVIHDFTLKRTTNLNGYIKNKTLKQLKQADAGNGETIPTLDESLRLINAESRVNIEIKGRDCFVELAQSIEYQINNKLYNPEHFLVSSFDHAQLLKFHSIMPGINTAVLVEKPMRKHLKLAAELQSESINPDYRFIDSKTLDLIHNAGFLAYAYTVDSNLHKEKMKRLGIDGFFTNFP
ncbi:MAG: glycerophosphodiester phosphodiesterase [Chlorobi bacterium]|nr:glycerophosphodiester phosphodiesterase [Chlorobiota bacterium]